MSTCTCRVRRAEAPEEGATEGGEGRGVAGTCDQSAVATPGWRSGAAIISTTSALSICLRRASTESRSWPGTASRSKATQVVASTTSASEAPHSTENTSTHSATRLFTPRRGRAGGRKQRMGE